MPKIITAKRLEGDTDKAREYVKAHIILPSALLGLMFMVAGAAALAYQLMVESYSWRTFLNSTGLLVAGGIVGWGQTRYHQYLLREHPGHFAARMKLFTRSGLRRVKRESPFVPLEHRGRNLVPLGYVLGLTLLFGLSGAASVRGEVYYLAGFLMPWVGFFWAKTYFWRAVLVEGKRSN